MKRQNKTEYRKDFNFKNGELFQRMGYLMDLSSHLYKDNKPLSKLYAYMMKDIRKRNALRIDSKLKKTICDLCNNLIHMDPLTRLELNSNYKVILDDSNKEILKVKCGECNTENKFILFNKS
jgi:RNase P subunit RPR2